MQNRIEIKLLEINNEAVRLRSLTPDALDSFMTVVSSLRLIAVSINSENVIFSIQEGSALCILEAPADTMNQIYGEVDRAIQGDSDDKEVTTQLRKIQDQFQRNSFNYSFVYRQPKRKDIDLYNRLVSTSRISIKRTRKPYVFKLKILRGFLNQIGGKDPNYHFDQGHGEKITIGCSKEQAICINKYLYQTINALVICKEWNIPDHNNEYTHKLIIEDKEIYILKTFLYKYYMESDLVDKLTVLHDFIDEQFEKSKDSHDILNRLLIGFNDKNLHISELKTLLVISKPFADHESIKAARLELLETYNLIRTIN